MVYHSFMAIILETVIFTTFLFCDEKLFKNFSYVRVYFVEKTAEMVLEKTS